MIQPRSWVAWVLRGQGRPRPKRPWRFEVWAPKGGSVPVLGRSEQDQLHAIFPFNISVVPGRDLEKIAGRYPSFGPRVDHADNKSARNAVARVVHGTGIWIAEKRPLIFLPCPARFEHRVH